MVANHDEAIKSYKQSLKYDSENEKVHFNLGSAYNATKMHASALKHYLKAIDLKGSNVSAYLCIGEVYIEM